MLQHCKNQHKTRLQFHATKVVSCSCMPIAMLAVQVFLSEQVLYSKQQLTSHKQHGDREGPLAESGFTGHCHCK